MSNHNILLHIQDLIVQYKDNKISYIDFAKSFEGNLEALEGIPFMKIQEAREIIDELFIADSSRQLGVDSIFDESFSRMNNWFNYLWSEFG